MDSLLEDDEVLEELLAAAATGVLDVDEGKGAVVDGETRELDGGG